MPSIRISKDLNDQMYFITCTTHNWYYLFDRHSRFHILADSLLYCQKQKGVKIYAYVFMLNHIHLIVQSSDVAGFLRDFKKFTTRELMRNIMATEPNITKLFPENSIWQSSNYPQIIETEDFFFQKKKYIEENPAKKEYVEKAEYWKYSSANPNSPIKIDSIF